MQYPKYLYHKTEAPKIVQTKEEHEALGKGWEETPAAFDKKQTPQTSQPQAGSDETGDQIGSGDNTDSQDPALTAPIDLADFANKSKAELIEFLVSKGVPEKGLKAKKVDDLISMIGKL